MEEVVGSSGEKRTTTTEGGRRTADWALNDDGGLPATMEGDQRTVSDNGELGLMMASVCMWLKRVTGWRGSRRQRSQW